MTSDKLFMKVLCSLSLIFFFSVALAGPDSECSEEKVLLHSEFLKTSIDAQRNTMGKDLVEPVKQKIQNFVSSQTELVVTEVSVISSAAKLPFYESVGGKKRIDPESDKRSFALAQEKANFAFQAMNELKKTQSQFEKIHFKTGAELAGPEFNVADLNTRFVTKMTEGYDKRLKELLSEHKDEFRNKALISSIEQLKDESQFSNLYQAKFRPFEGFRIQIYGHKKCKDAKSPQKNGSSKSATKQ